MPDGQLWFLDGKDETGKTVSNPNIGYGLRTIQYADGTTREFYQIGISANTTGISVYILGIKDKSYLAETYGQKLGKARVTGYGIKFKALRAVNLAVLTASLQDGVEQTRREQAEPERKTRYALLEQDRKNKTLAVAEAKLKTT